MRSLLMVVISIIFLAVGCAEDKLEYGTIPLGSEFSLPAGQTVTVDGYNSQLAVEITKIYDTRCPIDAFCIWEGYYGVDLSISDGTQSAPISLCNLFCGSTYKERDTATFVLNDHTYSVVLKDIEPYPVSTGSNEDKKAILEIFE